MEDPDEPKTPCRGAESERLILDEFEIADVAYWHCDKNCAVRTDVN